MRALSQRALVAMERHQWGHAEALASQRCYRKLGVSSRHQAVTRSRELRLLDGYAGLCCGGSAGYLHVGAGLSCGEMVARLHPRGLDADTDFPESHTPEQPRVRRFMPMAFLMPMA